MNSVSELFRQVGQPNDTINLIKYSFSLTNYLNKLMTL